MKDYPIYLPDYLIVLSKFNEDIQISITDLYRINNIPYNANASIIKKLLVEKQLIQEQKHGRLNILILTEKGKVAVKAIRTIIDIFNIQEKVKKYGSKENKEGNAGENSERESKEKDSSGENTTVGTNATANSDRESETRGTEETRATSIRNITEEK